MDQAHMGKAGTGGTDAAGAGAPLPSFWDTTGMDAVEPALRDAAADLAGLFAQIDGVGHLRGKDGADAGYARYGWTVEEAWLRVWFAAQLISRGFAVDVDPVGNQWAWAPGPDGTPWAGTTAHPGVTIGSHLDSVPGGGAFDGPLGTLSAIAAWDDLMARGLRPASPVGIVHWHDEEGARFAIACFGSRTLTGILPAGRALARVDADGITYAQALEAFPTLLDQVADQITRARAGASDVPAIARTLAGLDVNVTLRALAASAAPTPASLHADPDHAGRSAAHIELHVEQGCAQAELDAPVAVADQIWPHGRWRVDFDGEANHAGATPMGRRHDPMLAFARFVEAAHAEAERLDVRATIGRVEVTPGGVNVIPGHVTCWLDARADTADKVSALVAALERRGEEGQFSAGLPHDFRITRESWTEPTVFSANLRDRLAATLHAPVIGTAAGHDAGILAESGRPAAMIFTRNMTGASHTPAEYATPADCARGVRAYADATLVCADAIAQGWRPRP